MSKVDVSIIMLSYKHEQYISQAIEGVRMQQTKFSWELLIAEDCSPDNSSVICSRYAEDDLRIKYFRHDKNIGANPNFLYAYRKCQGKYIALCEGDDYWTDPLKLQKQVKFLEANRDFVICFHDVFELKQGNLCDNSISYEKDEFETRDLASGNFIQTPSVVFRNFGERVIPPYFSSMYVGDYVLHMQQSRFGKIKLLRDKMAVYRIHEGGGWSTKSEEFIYTRMSQYLEKFVSEPFSGDVKQILRRRLLSAYQNLFRLTGKRSYLIKLARIDLLSSLKFIVSGRATGGLKQQPRQA